MVAKPTNHFVYSTDTNHSAGPYVGNPTKVSPPGWPVNTAGFTPGTGIAAEYLNWLFNVLGGFTQWLAWGTSTGRADAQIVESDANGNVMAAERFGSPNGSGAADGSDLRIRPGRSGQADQLNGKFIIDGNDHNGNPERTSHWWTKTTVDSNNTAGGVETVFEVTEASIPIHTVARYEVEVFTQSGDTGPGTEGRGERSAYMRYRIVVAKGADAASFEVLLAEETHDRSVASTTPTIWSADAIATLDGSGGYARLNLTPRDYAAEGYRFNIFLCHVEERLATIPTAANVDTTT